MQRVESTQSEDKIIERLFIALGMQDANSTTISLSLSLSLCTEGEITLASLLIVGLSTKDLH